MTEDALARRVTRVGALADPVRRRLYRFISRQAEAVSRDQAADAVDVPRHTAKFHLERLVDAGLLVTEFRRLTGRTGPGAGRPAKLYRRAAAEVAVSVPSRRYDLAGEVLADAVERASRGVPIGPALEQAADAAAGTAVASAGEYDGDPASALQELLTRLGYEPDRAESGTSLRNCPYRRLAIGHRNLVCGINERFLTSLTDGLGCAATVARHQDGPNGGGCCVHVTNSL